MGAVPPPFSVDVQREPTRAVVCPHGELDLATVPELEAEIAALRDEGCDDLVLDLRGLMFLDSTGLRLLLTNRQQAEQDGWRFSIVDGEQPVLRVLEVSGVSPLFTRARPKP